MAEPHETPEPHGQTAGPTPSLLAGLDARAPPLAQALRRAVQPGPHRLPGAERSLMLALSAVAPLLPVLDPHALPLALQHAPPSRKLAHLAGRLCAEWALEALGLTGQGVGRVGRAPRWPEGVSGSITHTDDMACALVVAGATRSLGIDSEGLLDGPAFEAARDECLSDAERQRWARGPDAARQVSLIFVAKEAFFKAVHPRLQRFVGFDEVEMVELAMDGAHEGRGRALLRPSATLAPAGLVAPIEAQLALARRAVHAVIELPR